MIMLFLVIFVAAVAPLTRYSYTRVEDGNKTTETRKLTLFNHELFSRVRTETVNGTVTFTLNIDV